MSYFNMQQFLSTHDELQNEWDSLTLKQQDELRKFERASSEVLAQMAQSYSPMLMGAIIETMIANILMLRIKIAALETLVSVN